MTLGIPDTPSIVDGLHELLLAEGLKVVDDQRGGMGGLLLTLRGPVPDSGDHPVAEIQIAADRGQWTVALRFEGMSRFIDPRVWAAHLDSVAIGEPDVGQQASFVAKRLVDAA